MLLPTKGITQERALITVGSEILQILKVPASVSGLWERFNELPSRSTNKSKVTFDWFSLALASLYTMTAIDWTDDGRIRRNDVPS